MTFASDRVGKPLAIPVGETMRVLIFNLAGHEHAVDVGGVKEILRGPEISSVIEAPDFVEGVINLRNQTVPIVNLRKRLGLHGNDGLVPTESFIPSVIVTHHRDHLVGILVDSVLELLTVPLKKIGEPVELLTGTRRRFIKGLIHREERFLILLDLDAVFAVEGGGKNDICVESLLKTEDAFIRKTRIRKIVAFELDDELYGADIGDVAEIMKLSPIMPLPNVPDFILGLINVRGDVLPIMDLRELFHLNKKNFDGESRIIVMRGDDCRVGVVVDRVRELLRLPPELFQPPPPNAAKIDEACFKEVAAVEDRLLIVLDMRKILRENARGKKK